MAWALLASTRRAFRYSIMASRNCCFWKYRSPRSRYRAFLASGDREHPALRARTRVNGRRTFWRFMGLFWQVSAKNGIERLHVRDHAVRGLVYAALNRPGQPHERSICTIPQDRVPHQLDLRSDLSRNRFTLALKPVESDLHLVVLLDEIAINRNPGRDSVDRNTQPRGIDRLPPSSRKTVLGRVDIAALALRLPESDV